MADSLEEMALGVAEARKAILLKAAGWVIASANEANRIEATHIAFNLRVMAGDITAQERDAQMRRGMLCVVGGEVNWRTA